MAVVVIDTIKPKNNGTFPVVEAADVKVTNDKRLDAALNDKANQSDVTALQTAVAGKASQADLNALSNTVADKADKSALAETNTAVAGKQNALSESQLTACNSGITSALVTQIGTNTTAIAEKASQADLNTTNAALSGKANASDVNTSINDLQSQIDALVTPVTQDAEVENARVDTEGVTHATLKARIDSTEDKLNDYMEETDRIIIDKSENRFDSALQTASTIDPHYYVNGEPYSTTEYDNSFHCSGVFSVEPNKKYTIGLVPAVVYNQSQIVKPWGGATEGIFFYDSSMNYISDTSNGTFTTPANARYARFNYALVYNVNLSDLQTKCMVVYGDTLPGNYSAYYETETIKTKVNALNTELNDYMNDTNEILNYESINKFDPSTQTALTIDEHFYYNGEPHETTQYDNQYHCSGVFEIEESTQYTIGLIPAVIYNDTPIVKPWGYTPEGIFFYDSSMNYITKSGNNAFTTPEGAKYARFNYALVNGVDLVDLQTKCVLVKGSTLPSSFTPYYKYTINTKVDYIEADVNTIDNIVNYNSGNKFNPDLQTIRTIDKHYYVNGEPYETTEYDNKFHCSGVFEIEANKKYTIGLVPAVSYEEETIVKPWGNATEGIFFYDSSMNYISDTSNNTFTTPANAKYARFNYIFEKSVDLVTIKDKVMLVYGDILPTVYSPFHAQNVQLEVNRSETKKKNKTKIKCYVDNDKKGICVVSKYSNSNDIVYELRQKGGNNLFDFHKIGLVNNTRNDVEISDSIEYFLSNSGDWHSPFIVSAVNNKNGDNINSHYFTGGNHQYNNEESGSTATARCTNLHFYADNKEFDTDTTCDYLEIYWENYVQAYDTTKADGSGREVLIEKHHLYFDGVQWKSQVDIVPLEDVTVEKWYGFQWFGATSIYKNIRYIGGTSREFKDASAATTTSGNGTATQMTSYGTTHNLEMWLDTSFDLGDMSFFDEAETHSIFTTDYGKGYFWIIKNKSLSKDNYYSAIGYYKFSPVI